MKMGNAAFDLAELRSEQERDAGILSASTLVNRTGSQTCVDCTDLIEEARRKAAPFAERCIECQGIHELKARRI